MTSTSQTFDVPEDLLREFVPINAPRGATAPLYPGDFAPWFQLPSDVRERFQIQSVGGRRVILCFVPSMGSQPGQDVVQRLLAESNRFASPGAGLLFISADPADVDKAPPSDVDGIRFLFDRERVATRLYGVAGSDGVFQPMSFILDERLRVAAVITFDDAETHVARILALYDELGEQPPARLASPQAPVLIVPGVFELAFCKRLIAGYESTGGRETGFMVERNGRTVEERDVSHKRRSDWIIEDAELRAACRVRMLRRVVPEIQRAFQFDVLWIERYIVACYDSAVQGHFAAHRDNTTKGTAHRRFAVTINLNGDFEGGYLKFPEFGRAHFKPPAGGACVFSCSLLHEATAVTSGRRYAFLPFLYDGAAQTLRDENAQYVNV
jgi:peroxiredoxin